MTLSTKLTSPSLKYIFLKDNRKMAYWQWIYNVPENENNKIENVDVVICVHGLTRQARDFDTLALSILEKAEQDKKSVIVICPDMAGRGFSDKLDNPDEYSIATYVVDMFSLIDSLNKEFKINKIDWVGTSMGGIIGLAVFATAPENYSLNKLVLNDVGPSINYDAVSRIGKYVSYTGPFDDLSDALEYLQRITKPFGKHTPEQFLGLSNPMLREIEINGKRVYKLHYDNNIAVAFNKNTPEIHAANEELLWGFYKSIKQEILILRGMESDLLDSDVAARMLELNLNSKLKEFENVGHAPTLMQDEQVKVVLDFLENKVGDVLKKA